MKPVAQQHSFGCGVACLAFILDIKYQGVVKAINEGRYKAGNKGFLCKELVDFLNNKGLDYHWKYVNIKIRNIVCSQGTVVFIKRSKRYPVGHYLARYKDKWMDPWVNFPNKNIKAGFRKRLPGKPIYAILPK